MQVERIIARYLDEHLYNNATFTKHLRTDNLSEQLKGSDIVLSNPSLNLENVVVDEKAITHYLTEQIPTFALELSFIARNGSLMEGWFTDTDKVTDYYLFAWPLADKEWDIELSNIKHVDYALVKRSKIIEWLSNQGFPIEKLREKAEIIRNTVTENGPIDKVYGKDFWFFMSERLAECPINVIIKRSVYEKLAVLTGHC